MAKQTFPSIVTPAVVAAFAYTEEPDTHYGEANAKYRISVKIPKDELEDTFGFVGSKKVPTGEIIALLHDLQKQHGVEPGASGACRDGDTMKTAEGKPKEDMHGFWVLTGKSKNRPRRIDTGRNPIPLTLPIRGGDLVRVLLNPAQYPKAGGGYGLTVYLDEVMLVDKRAGGMIPAEEGGFVYEGDLDDDEAPAAPAGNGDF